MIILPRQARDKRRESKSTRERYFLTAGRLAERVAEHSVLLQLRGCRELHVCMHDTVRTYSGHAISVFKPKDLNRDWSPHFSTLWIKVAGFERNLIAEFSAVFIYTNIERSRYPSTGRENGDCFGAFPMFVPSLSWQNDRFLYINGSKMPFSAGRLRRQSGVRSQFFPINFLVFNSNDHLPRQARDKHENEHCKIDRSLLLCNTAGRFA